VKPNNRPTLAIVHAAAPPVGSVVVTTWPWPSPATQRKVDGQETLRSWRVPSTWRCSTPPPRRSGWSGEDVAGPVDDEAQIGRTLSSVLSSAGYRCKQAANATEGAAMLDREPFDLVICDLRVSEEGIALLDQIERDHRGTATSRASTV